MKGDRETGLYVVRERLSGEEVNIWERREEKERCGLELCWCF